MVVSFNFYYARPGVADQVLQQRLRASEVRQRIDLPHGRVMRRTAGTGDLPDVIWQHEFDEVADHHADMAVRAASPEFESIRAGMRQLIRRFERPLFEVCGAAAATAAPQPRGSGVVTLDWISCAPEKAAELLTALERQAALHAEQGLARGRLLRLITPGTDLPAFMWQREHADAASYERTQDKLAACAPLQADDAGISRLSNNVKHSVWLIA